MKRAWRRFVYRVAGPTARRRFWLPFAARFVPYGLAGVLLHLGTGWTL